MGKNPAYIALLKGSGIVRNLGEGAVNLEFEILDFGFPGPAMRCTV